jgi:hypothetical protein
MDQETLNLPSIESPRSINQVVQTKHQSIQTAPKVLHSIMTQSENMIVTFELI